MHKRDIETEMKKTNEKKLEEEAHKRMIEEHVRVAEGMRSLYISKEKRGMWQSDVIESLQNNPNGVFSSTQDLRQIITSISKILPDWLKVFHIPKGVFLRMDRDRIQIL